MRQLALLALTKLGDWLEGRGLRRVAVFSDFCFEKLARRRGV